MPGKIVSKAQQRYMFMKHPEIAKEMAGGQSFKGLPEHVKKAKTAKTPQKAKK